MEVLYGVEGVTDVPVAEHLIRWAGREPRQVLVAQGKTRLDERLHKWNNPSNKKPFLVLRDWDQSDRAECVLSLLDIICGAVSLQPSLAVRIPVRSIESWLIADRQAFKSFFGVEVGRLPPNPDDEPDPKRVLVDACRHSSKRTIRDGMVPKEKAGRPVGYLYESMVIEFVSEHWEADRARAVSPSLDRTMNRLHQLVVDGIW